MNPDGEPDAQGAGVIAWGFASWVVVIIVMFFSSG